MPAPALAEALRQVVRAASNDDARPLLTGVLVAAEGGRDPAGGDRLLPPGHARPGRRRARWPEGADQILVPARALTELQRLLPGGGRQGRRRRPTVGFSVSELDATFTVGGVRLTTRLLDGRFPDYRQLIPPGLPEPAAGGPRGAARRPAPGAAAGA